MTDMTIGEFAATAGVGIETIRYYEREHVLPAPRRAPSGYRQYGDADVWRLAFIQRAKDFGFTLREITELLGAGEDRTVDEVQAVTRRRLVTVERDLISLSARRDNLERLLETCTGGAADDCVQLRSARTP